MVMNMMRRTSDDTDYTLKESTECFIRVNGGRVLYRPDTLSKEFVGAEFISTDKNVTFDNICGGIAADLHINGWDVFKPTIKFDENRIGYYIFATKVKEQYIPPHEIKVKDVLCGVYNPDTYTLSELTSYGYRQTYTVIEKSRNYGSLENGLEVVAYFKDGKKYWVQIVGVKL